MSEDDKDVLAARIIATWRKRQDAIRNIRAKVAVDCTVRAGFTISHAKSDSSRFSPPDRNHEYSRVVSVFLDYENQRRRVDEEGGIWAMHLGRVVQEKRISTFLNGRGKTYEYCNWPESALVHHGLIGGEDAFSEETGAGASPYMAPVIWYVRPLEYWKAENLRVVGIERHGSSELVECQVSRRRRAWLDADRDYVIVRCEGRSQITIDYGPADRYGPVPKQWMSVQPQGSGIGTVTTSRFLEREINGVLTESMFEFEFPEGTTVDEMGGSNRTLTVEKENLVPLSRIDATERNDGWPRVWIVAANAAVVAFLLSAYLLRRRLQRA